jgi:predicted HicB family RNase H-like nuclease
MKPKPIEPVSKNGQNMTLRMRDGLVPEIKQAAKKTGLSLNTWVNEVLSRAVEATK